MGPVKKCFVASNSSTVSLTVAPPDLGQVAAALAGLLAELHHVPARGLRSDGHLGGGLFPIAEVNRQYHLQRDRERGRVWGQG